MKIHTKRRKANNNEPWIGELLDEVSEDKLLEMSAIPTDIPLPLPNQEKLARTVIDKADVFDEQERERRKQYEKAYCRKQFLRATDHRRYRVRIYCVVFGWRIRQCFAGSLQLSVRIDGRAKL